MSYKSSMSAKLPVLEVKDGWFV